MKPIYTLLLICILSFAMTGCENYDKAMKGIEKGKEFVDNAEKKVTETRKDAEKSFGRILGKETAKSDDKKADEQERKGGKKEKDKEKD